MVTVVWLLSMTFQVLGKVHFTDILPNITINGSVWVMALIVYLRKRKGKNSNILPWVVGFTSVTAPLLTKFDYGIKVNWTYASQSINSSAALTIFAVMLYLYYKPLMFKIMTAYAFIVWVLFIAVAYHNGAEYHIETFVSGVAVNSGTNLLREIFFLIVMALVCVIAYLNIPTINNYDRKTNEQTAQISKYIKKQKSVAAEIKEKMTTLFSLVNTQNQLSDQFSEKMQSQAATFEEMAASLEELLGSAENIASVSSDQLSGNIKMEEIINQFKSIQSDTKKNLNETLGDIEAVVNFTSDATAQIQAVEGTVVGIKEQSDRIKETIGIIVDIADKINLLSLNAAIEAARAGDSGRGFAVVADEIGKLAFQTQESIKEIHSVLQMSANNSTEGVTVIQQTASVVREMITRMSGGSQKIRTLQNSILFEDKQIMVIIDQMYKNIELARHIGIGTDEQKKAIEASGKAIEHMNEMLAVMVSEMQELAQSSHDIYRNAIELMAKTDESV
jgi:methyl-accepting chemotaxis protein/chromate transport protein ChrA